MPKDAPVIGKGRWSLPNKATKDEMTLDEIINKGMIAQQEIERLTDTPREHRQESPQVQWNMLNKDIASITKRCFKHKDFKMKMKINNLEKDLQQNMMHLVTDDNEVSREEIATRSKEKNSKQ